MAKRHKRLGARLQRIREVKGMTTRELARKTGISVDAVLGIEAGKTSLTLDMCEKLARSLGCNPVELAGWTTPGEHEDGAPQEGDAASLPST